MRAVLTVVLMLAIAGCDKPQAPSGPPLVVYASKDDPANLVELFDAFSTETGIPIAAVWGESGSNTQVVITKTGTPADVLITPNIADIWQASDNGALRPIASEALETVPATLKDPDGFWAVLQHRTARIVVSPTSDAEVDGDYRALAKSPYEGKLCLTSITNSANQALIAMLIEDFGVKPAERAVRGWIRNLAVAPFGNEEQLLAALESGDCKIGIVSDASNAAGMKITGNSPYYFDVSAVGVGRHANSPEKAQRLVAWLMSRQSIVAPVDSNGRNVGVAGWRNQDALLLAERAGYR